MNENIRTFIAAELPEKIKQEINNYIISLKKTAPEVKWVKARGIHITIKFLGEISLQLCEQVKGDLSGISDIAKPFKITINDSGAFPNKHRPRVIWLGLEQDAENSLVKLHKWVDNKLSPLGFEKEKRKYSPHLTIGRVKKPEQLNKLFQYLDETPLPVSTFDVNEIVLMQSELKSTGAVYAPIRKYDFVY
jgi:2'-5' RNA ligase